MTPLRFTLPLATFLLLASLPTIAQEQAASATPDPEPCDLATALDRYPPRLNF